MGSAECAERERGGAGADFSQKSALLSTDYHREWDHLQMDGEL